MDWINKYGQSLGSMITAIALIIGGAWAIWSYHESKSRDSAEWLHRLFTGFFVDAGAKSFRMVMEYDYHDRLLPLVERSLINELASYTPDEQRVLSELDTILNYLEFVIHLEKRGSLKRRDREAMFGFWFQELKRPDRAALRYYFHRFGFEGLAGETCTGHPPGAFKECIAFYGTLKEGSSVQAEIGVKDGLRKIGTCEIHGKLVPVEDYAGLVPGPGRVPGELFKVLDPTVFGKLDEYEEFYPDGQRPSLYRRVVVRLASPPRDAWVYVSADSTKGRAELVSARD